jgi:hypothetical protein
VLQISGENKETKWRELQSQFESSYSLRAFYFRFHQGSGHIVVERSLADAKLSELESNGVKLGEDSYKVNVCTGEELKQFWAQHGDHYNTCLRNLCIKRLIFREG